MMCKYPILGQVTDVNRELWHVRDVRTTKYGFDLLLGTPAKHHGTVRGGLPRLIATTALRDFWETNRALGRGLLYDLPAGRTTLKRARRRLGFNYLDDVTEFWTDRIDDLATLPVREFAVRHGVDPAVAIERRFRMVGRRARQIGWWRDPAVRGILVSDLTLSETGRKLGISISQAKRLRDQAKQELPIAA